jgi:hypothetical protein
MRQHGRPRIKLEDLLRWILKKHIGLTWPRIRINDKLIVNTRMNLRYSKQYWHEANGGKGTGISEEKKVISLERRRCVMMQCY